MPFRTAHVQLVLADGTGRLRRVRSASSTRMSRAPIRYAGSRPAATCRRTVLTLTPKLSAASCSEISCLLLETVFVVAPMSSQAADDPLGRTSTHKAARET